jgi:hypothetical protein
MRRVISELQSRLSLSPPISLYLSQPTHPYSPPTSPPPHTTNLSPSPHSKLPASPAVGMASPAWTSKKCERHSSCYPHPQTPFRPPHPTLTHPTPPLEAFSPYPRSSIPLHLPFSVGMTSPAWTSGNRSLAPASNNRDRRCAKRERARTRARARGSRAREGEERMDTRTPPIPK